MNKKILNIELFKNKNVYINEYFDKNIFKNYPLKIINHNKEPINTIYTILDFSNFIEWQQSYEYSFYEYLDFVKQNSSKDVLVILKTINELLIPKGTINVFILGKKNWNTIKQFFLCANFININISNNLVSAQKKELLSYPFRNNKLIFKEVSLKNEINAIQIFAKKLFSKFNYNIEIDMLFWPSSKYYYIYNKENGQILNFLRFSWYLPKHPLPCMLATDQNNNHIKIDSPEKNNYGELFSPFILSVNGIRIYRELVFNILNYFIEMKIKTVFTTTDANSLKNIQFFKNKFDFQNTNIQLQYGDFGKVWTLLKGTPQSINTAYKFIKNINK